MGGRKEKHHKGGKKRGHEAMGQQLATVGGKRSDDPAGARGENVWENAQHFDWEDSSERAKEYFII